MSEQWWYCLAGCLFVGALGGLVKPFSGQAVFLMPQFSNGVWVPGFLGALVVGAIAGGLYWLLYGPDLQATPPRTQQQIGIAVASAFLVGLSGAGWITSESNAYLSKATAKEVARDNPELVKKIDKANPVEALTAAKQK